MNPKLRKKIKYLYYDGETQHGSDKFKFPLNINDGFEHMTFHNEPNTISAKVFDFINQTSKNHVQYMIKVIGEEDLLAFPAALFYLQTRPHYVFYGQHPSTDNNLNLPAGLVVLWTIQCVREKINNLFHQLKKPTFV